MQNIIFIQARLSSSRFPKKMLHKLGESPLVEYVYKRCLTSKKSGKVVVLTSCEENDDTLFTFCNDKGIEVFRGSLENVLQRFIEASKQFQAKYICRVCGDSPFVDVDAIDIMFELIHRNSLDYICITECLNGFTSEVFRADLLKSIYNEELSNKDKEHVTKYIKDNKDRYKTDILSLHVKPSELEDITLTVDYPEDLDVADKVVQKLDGFDFTSHEVIKILKEIQDEL